MYLQLSMEEIEKLNNGFEENSVLPQNGMFLGGLKYMVVQGDAGIVVRGKKVCCARIITLKIILREEKKIIWFSAWKLWSQLMKD